MMVLETLLSDAVFDVLEKIGYRGIVTRETLSSRNDIIRYGNAKFVDDYVIKFYDDYVMKYYYISNYTLLFFSYN